MRYGFTTGSCAAAAAKASAVALFSGKKKETITIETPKGILFQAVLEWQKADEKKCCCGVRKDGGDDPDVTTGLLVCAAVSVKEMQEDGLTIEIEGKEGVGRVTKPGLDQPVGEAAINHVPREMIQREVSQVCGLFDFHGTILVEISVPGGEEIAKKTFNPRLGISGGISILGTSGIVEPMSSQALLDTIHVELNVWKESGRKQVAVTPGNYGKDFMQKAYGYDLDLSVKCSNFIGKTIDMAAELGFEALLLTGHIGKLIKLAGGLMNTHSREGDCRMEILAAAAIQAGADLICAKTILEAVTTEEGVQILQNCGKLEETMRIVVDKISFYLHKRAAGRIQIECILYATQFGELAKTRGAETLLKKIQTEK
ncbi:MAG: cobalt-precorrin-5B (C(1))-methyltransferase CbiD [Lachnospiraceae bacterium]